MPISTSIIPVTETSSTAEVNATVLVTDDESNTAGTLATSMVAIIAGTVAGAIVLIISLLIIISVVVYLMKKKKKKQTSLSLQTTPITTGHLNSHAAAAIEMEQNQAYTVKVDV